MNRKSERILRPQADGGERLNNYLRSRSKCLSPFPSLLVLFQGVVSVPITGIQESFWPIMYSQKRGLSRGLKTARGGSRDLDGLKEGL